MSVARRVFRVASAIERGLSDYVVVAPRLGARVAAVRLDKGAVAVAIAPSAVLISQSPRVHADANRRFRSDSIIHNPNGCTLNGASSSSPLQKTAHFRPGRPESLTRGVLTMASAGASSSAVTDAVGKDEGVSEILAFWFGDFMRPGYDGPAPSPSEQVSKAPVWFRKDADVDSFIRTRFTPLIPLAALGQLASWEETPHGALALVVLLDQFTRNSFRGSPDAFAHDKLAVEVAERAIAKGFDRKVPMVGWPFFYLPYEHAEDLASQDLCIKLMTQMLEEAPEGPVKGFFRGGLNFAHSHRDIIMKFGRYPHRNEVLGRESTPAELEFMKTHGGF